MWKIIINFIGSFWQAISTLLGSPDFTREFKMKVNSAERFVNWGNESKNPIDFKEALALINQAPLESATAIDKLRYFQIKSLAQIGIISSKIKDYEKFNDRIKKKYETDQYMDEVINAISNSMKEIQNIISVAESGDLEKIKSLMGENKKIEIKPDEIILDAKKEFDSFEDDFIYKKSIKENKMFEIKNFKNKLATEIFDFQEQIILCLQEMDKLEVELKDTEIENKNQIKDHINLKLQSTINELNNAGIPLKGNKGGE